MRLPTTRSLLIAVVVLTVVFFLGRGCPADLSRAPEAGSLGQCGGKEAAE